MFSVLICTYLKDNPFYFEKSLYSIFNQSTPPQEVVLIIDGEVESLTKEIILKYQIEYKDSFKPIWLQKNVGIAKASNIGITFCSNTIVAKVDADDECFFNRFEKQFIFLAQNPEISVVGSYMNEFYTQPNDSFQEKKKPVYEKEIKKYSKYRCPLNNPSVMFRKEHILAVGGYQSVNNLFEDYYLWLRLLKAGYKIANIPECLVYYNVGNGLINRRHGLDFLKTEYSFFTICKREKLIPIYAYYITILIRLPLRLMPKKMLQLLYKILH